MDKRMPYKIEEGAIEQAKYRAKMAVREVAHPTKVSTHRVVWRWAVACGVALIVVGIGQFMRNDYSLSRKQTPMERLLAEMQSASDDIIYDLAIDSDYYQDEESSFAL